MDQTTILFNRDSLPPEIKDTACWPSVDPEMLNQKDKALYQKREEAVTLYISGEAHKSITKKTGVSRAQTSKLVRKCLKSHSDGKIFGFRGLLPYTRQKEYLRISPIKKQLKKAGYSGALNRLFAKYPLIKEKVDDVFLKRGRDGKIHESRIPVKSIHKIFIDACRSAEISSDQYPFRTEYQGLRGFSYYLRKLFNLHFSEAVKARHGGDTAKTLNTVGSGPSKEGATRPYQRVEFDGHKLDLFMVIEIPTIHGDANYEVIERLWLLTVIDSFSRAILGYHVSMGTEYSQYDVLQTFKKSIIPWKPRKFLITGLNYKKGAGFPSGIIDQYSWARWNEIAYDNAKANLAEATKETLKETVRCQINAGPVKTPERRGILERWHHTLEENGFHRLPSTTGYDQFDTRRVNPEKAAWENRIKFDEVLELLEVLIANYNATPHSGIGYKTPLEMLTYYASQDYALINRIDAAERVLVNRLDMRISVTVKGKVEEGRRPYIQFLDVRYRNDVLTSSPHLIGQKLSCYVNTEDLRTMVAYLPDGSELGILVANGKWGVTPHTLKMRKVITALKKKKIIDYLDNDDPVMVYMEYLQQKAPDSKKAAKDFAEAHKAGVTAPQPKAVTKSQQRTSPTPPPTQDTSSSMLDRLSKLKGMNK